MTLDSLLKSGILMETIFKDNDNCVLNVRRDRPPHLEATLWKIRAGAEK